MKHAHFNEATGEILGFYDDGLHLSIPKPVVPLDDAEWLDCINNSGLRVIDIATLTIVAVAPLPVSPEQLAAEMELALEAYTDEVAQNGPRRYRNAESCVSYITTSKDPQVVAEAQAYADWRDDFWNAAEAIKADVLDGIRTAPTYEEAIDELPKMVWP